MKKQTNFLSVVALVLACLCNLSVANAQTLQEMKQTVQQLMNECAQEKTQLEATCSGVSQTAASLENSHAMHVQQCPNYSGAFCYDWAGKKAARDAELDRINRAFFLPVAGLPNKVTVLSSTGAVLFVEYDSNLPPMSYYGGRIFYAEHFLSYFNTYSEAAFDTFVLVQSKLRTLKQNLIDNRESLRTGYLLPLYQDVNDEQNCYNAFQQSGGCGGGGGYPY